MSTTTTFITVEEFLRIPDPREGHYELHYGQVILMAPPKWGHEEIQERIRDLFKRLMANRGTVRVEMSFRPFPEHEVWRADVGVVYHERAACTAADGYLQGAPDLVVEVLSPSNTAQEISEKMHICLPNGCSSFWVVNDKQKEVEITGADFVTRRFNQQETIFSDILGGSLQVNEIFFGTS
jgi:Uma2 family endonuclease